MNGRAESGGSLMETPVLVTGGAGFIGSHLVERLVDGGAVVTVLDNCRGGTWDNLSRVRHAIRTVTCDVRDRSAVERAVRTSRPRVAIHLAANASVPHSVEEPAYDFEVNCGGTFVLLDVLRQTGGCERIVTASSGAVYGEPTTFPVVELHPLRPISPYGASKLAAEVVSRMFHSVYHLPVVVARLFNTYGPRMARFVVLDFLRKLECDPSRLEVLGAGTQVRDFTYVSDTVEGLLLIAARGAAGDAYNVSSGVHYQVADLAGRIARAVNPARPAEIVFTGRSWVGDVQRWEVSIEKLRSLGYEPRVSLSAGLEATIEWYFDGGRRASRLVGDDTVSIGCAPSDDR